LKLLSFSIAFSPKNQQRPGYVKLRRDLRKEVRHFENQQP